MPSVIIEIRKTNKTLSGRLLRFGNSKKMPSWMDDRMSAEWFVEIFLGTVAKFDLRF